MTQIGLGFFVAVDDAASLATLVTATALIFRSAWTVGQRSTASRWCLRSLQLTRVDASLEVAFRKVGTESWGLATGPSIGIGRGSDGKHNDRENGEYAHDEGNRGLEVLRS
jgi:hypothetical protein